MRHRSPDEIQVGGRSLSEILDDHDTWLQSGCEKGVRAKLAGADLSSVHLADRDLRQADLTEADLRGADLSRLRLNGAVLRDTDFRHATLSNADLSDDADPVTIRNSPLIGAIPTDTEGMAVGGADLTIAAVPESFPLARMVARCERITWGVRRVAVLMSVLLAVGLYWVLTTTDAELLLDTEVFRVPFTQVPVTTTMIYWLAPPEILLAFFWWHLLYLDRLWRWGGGLPALFPDGSSLASRSALWPLNVFAAQWMPQLKEETLTPRWAPVPRWLVEGALFWATPLVLAAFWWRYLTLQEPAGAALIIVTLASAAGLAHSRSRVGSAGTASGRLAHGERSGLSPGCVRTSGSTKRDRIRGLLLHGGGVSAGVCGAHAHGSVLCGLVTQAGGGCGSGYPGSVRREVEGKELAFRGSFLLLSGQGGSAGS